MFICQERLRREEEARLKREEEERKRKEDERKVYMDIPSIGGVHSVVLFELCGVWACFRLEKRPSAELE
eukprot:1347048-Amorphochlora_amoeboformis.AAC.1